MKIGICIPCHYAHVVYLDRILYSIEQQTTLPHIVCISISGMPTQHPGYTNMKFPVKVISTREKKNAAENRNIAARAIFEEVDVLSFIDADDYMHPYRLREIEHAFEKHNPDIFLHNYKPAPKHLDTRMSDKLIQEYQPSEVFLTNCFKSIFHNGSRHGQIVASTAEGADIPIHNAHVSCRASIFNNEEFQEDAYLARLEDSHFNYELLNKGYTAYCTPDILSLYSL